MSHTAGRDIACSYVFYIDCECILSAVSMLVMPSVNTPLEKHQCLDILVQQDSETKSDLVVMFWLELLHVG